MHDKRYSVFISSTFEDLKVERRAVQDVVISAGDFPVQMESFPAADEDQFEFIKALIDKCDYYVLIVAGRYGTPAEDGMSYTEKEYRYAVSKGIPVLVMLHGDRGNIPANKSEDTVEGKKRLAEFVTCPLNLLSVLFWERRIGSWISRRKERPRGSGMRIPSLLRTG